MSFDSKRENYSFKSLGNSLFSALPRFDLSILQNWIHPTFNKLSLQDIDFNQSYMFGNLIYAVICNNIVSAFQWEQAALFRGVKTNT